MKDDDIMAAFLPLRFTQFLTGSLPQKLTKNPAKNEMLRKRIYNYVPVVVVIITFSVYLVYKQQQLSNYLAHKDNALIKFINLMYFMIVLGFSFTSYVWSKIQKRSTIKLWNMFIKLDADLKTCGIQFSYKCIRGSTIRFLFFGFFCINSYIIYLLLTQEFVDKLQGIASYGLIYFVLSSHMVICCSFLTLIRTVNYICNNLFVELQWITRESETNCLLFLKQIMCRHHDLFEILQLINKVFSAQIVLSFAINFVLVTFQTYNTICSIYNKSPYLNYAVAGTIFVGTGVIEKFILTFACHKCMFQSTTLKRTLAKCLAKHSTNRNISRELNAFSLQLLHETFEIYAGNMFLIDLPVFTSICGTATTYIILLWQTDTGVDLNYSMKKVFGVV